MATVQCHRRYDLVAILRALSHPSCLQPRAELNRAELFGQFMRLVFCSTGTALSVISQSPAVTAKDVSQPEPNRLYSTDRQHLLVPGLPGLISVILVDNTTPSAAVQSSSLHFLFFFIVAPLNLIAANGCASSRTFVEMFFSLGFPADSRLIDILPFLSLPFLPLYLLISLN